MTKRPFSTQELSKFKDLIKINNWFFQVKFDESIVITRTDDLEKYDTIINLLEHYTNIIEITAYKNGDLNNRNAVDKRFFVINGIPDGLGGLNTVQEQASNLFKKQMDDHKMTVLEKENRENLKYIDKLESDLEALQAEKQQGALMFGTAGLLGGFINGFVKKSPQLLGVIPEAYRGLIGVENVEIPESSSTGQGLSEDDKWLLQTAKNIWAMFTPEEFTFIVNTLCAEFQQDKSMIYTCNEIIKQIKQQPNSGQDSSSN